MGKKKKAIVYTPFLAATGATRKLPAPAVVTKYQKRISSPLLDRIDIHIKVSRVDYEKLSGNKLGETSESISKRAQVAREIILCIVKLIFDQVLHLQSLDFPCCTRFAYHIEHFRSFLG